MQEYRGTGVNIKVSTYTQGNQAYDEKPLFNPQRGCPYKRGVCWHQPRQQCECGKSDYELMSQNRTTGYFSGCSS